MVGIGVRKHAVLRTAMPGNDTGEAVLAGSWALKMPTLGIPMSARGDERLRWTVLFQDVDGRDKARP